ncbi:D-glycero-D-manno-heptose 1,7-bisphosphate phosphatase [Azospirillaceae bacterium]
MTKQAVILAGGRGSRLGALTAQTPKPLLPCGDRPFLLHLIENLARFGFRDQILLVGPYEAIFREALSDVESRFKVSLTLVSEPEPAGTAGALLWARERLAERFLMLNGDCLFDFNYLDMTSASAESSEEIARLALRPLKETGRFGTVLLDGDRILEFSEKAGGGEGVINGGVYWMRRKALDEIARTPCSIERDVFPALAMRGALRGSVYHGEFLDIGTPDDFARVEDVLERWRYRPAVFFDRDGVLNLDSGYVCRPEEFVWVEGASEAIKDLNDRGFLVFVVTNQSGVARGYYDAPTVERLHGWMNEQLATHGAHIDRFYYCPHPATEPISCGCRKPAPGMIMQALGEWPIRRAGSFMVGDKETDVAAAAAAGVPGYLFSGGNLSAFIKAKCLFE